MSPAKRLLVASFTCLILALASLLAGAEMAPYVAAQLVIFALYRTGEK